MMMNLLTPRLETIPQALKNRPQWVVWIAELKSNGKVDKIPINARTGELASSTDPDTWSSYDEAVAAYKRNPDRYAGIGYVFAADDPYAGADLDNCIDEHGVIADWAQAIIADLDSYAEDSPSGTGVKIICIGDLPSNAKQKSIELYDYARFFTITGHHLPQTPRDIRDAHDSLRALHARIKPADDDAPPRVAISLATEKTDHLQRWADRIATYALRMVAQAQAGEKHHMRIKAAKLWAGLIPHGLATAAQIESGLFHAQKPKDHAKKEFKAIQDAIAYGAKEPLDPPPEPPQPVFDDERWACCPHGHGRLIKSKNGNGWRCARRACFWWDGTGYTPPQGTAHHDRMPTIETGRRWLTEDEVNQLTPPTWLVKHVIPAGEVTVLDGPGDSGKTMIAIDLTKRVAQYYRTMYIAGEDASGIKVRKRAWELFHKRAPNGNFLVWPDALPLYEEQEVTRFITEVRGLGLKLIIIDTLSQSITGADENSAADMTIVMHNCQRIAHELGAAVLILHHTTKDGSNYRGSSVIKNNSYGFLEVNRTDELIRLECERIKNTRPFNPHAFRLVTVTTDITDEEGAPIESCVLVPSHQVIQTDKDALTPTQRKMLETLELMTDAQGGARTTELQSVVGLSGNSFYQPLKVLRTHGFIDKPGDKHTDPLIITNKGRKKLAEHLSTAAESAGSSPAELFEVNPRLGELLPLLPGSNFGSSNSSSNSTEGASYHDATNEKARSDAVTTTATNLLPTSSGSSGVLTTTTPGLLDREVGSNSGRNNGREHPSSEHCYSGRRLGDQVDRVFGESPLSESASREVPEKSVQPVQGEAFPSDPSDDLLANALGSPNGGDAGSLESPAERARRLMEEENYVGARIAAASVRDVAVRNALKAEIDRLAEARAGQS